MHAGLFLYWSHASKKHFLDTLNILTWLYSSCPLHNNNVFCHYVFEIWPILVSLACEVLMTWVLRAIGNSFFMTIPDACWSDHLSYAWKYHTGSIVLIQVAETSISFLSFSSLSKAFACVPWKMRSSVVCNTDALHWSPRLQLLCRAVTLQKWCWLGTSFHLTDAIPSVFPSRYVFTVLMALSLLTWCVHPWMANLLDIGSKFSLKSTPTL